MKFGGTSLASGEKISHVASIVTSMGKNHSIVMIVSAMEGVTNSLIAIFQHYKKGNVLQALDAMRYLYEAHKQVLDDLLLNETNYSEAKDCLHALFGKLSLYFTLCKAFSEADYDYIISFGERFSACLMSAALNNMNASAKAVDGSSVIVADETFCNAKALLKPTKLLAIKCLLPLLQKNIVPVVTGFFAMSQNGNVVTLGRGGSDYSATVLAYALEAKEVVLWKEVNGVYSNDPKKDTSAIFYPQLSYEKALELAKNGAKILHPEAMKPVSSKNIVVWVKNTFNPEFIGTKICKGEIV